MTATVRKHSNVREVTSLAIVLAIDVLMFGFVPIFQVVLMMASSITIELPITRVVASIALAVLCLACSYWVWKGDTSARYLLLAGITISSIISGMMKITALRGEQSMSAWLVLEYFGPTFLCLLLNWLYFLPAAGKSRVGGAGEAPV